jgi:hypothetical protein
MKNLSSKKLKAAKDLVVNVNATPPEEKETKSQTPHPEQPYNLGGYSGPLTETKTAVMGTMDLEKLQGLVGGDYGVSGYRMIVAKPQLIMPLEPPVLMWFNKCKNPAFSVTDLIKQGTELFQSNLTNYNSLMSVFSYQGAEWSIHLGKILITLKSLVRKSGQIWGVWAVKNIAFVGERTREKMMRLARRKDCWKYSILGPERLDILCAAIPESKDGSDAIGAFLEKYQIKFDPTQEFNLDEFKRQVDCALAESKLQIKGLTILPAKVAALVDNGFQIDGAVIKEFQTIQRSGGDLGTHVDYLLTSGGRENSDKTPEQRLQDVNNLAARLTKSIDFILNKQDLVDMIDRDIYRRLIEKLNDISMLRDMATDYEAVATQVSV